MARTVKDQAQNRQRIQLSSIEPHRDNAVRCQSALPIGTAFPTEMFDHHAVSYEKWVQKSKNLRAKI